MSMLSGRRWVSFLFPALAHTAHRKEWEQSWGGKWGGERNKYPEKYFVAREGQRGGKYIPILHDGYAMTSYTYAHITPEYTILFIRTIQQYVPSTQYVYVLFG